MSREWTTRAKCRGDNPDKYDLDKVNLTPGQLTGYAALLCRDCPVARICAQDALHYRDTGVIRGGVAIRGDASYRDLETVARFGETPTPTTRQLQRLKGASRKKPVTEQYRRNQRRWQIRRMKERWQDRCCAECGVPVKSGSLPQDVWPERLLAHDPSWRRHVCTECGQRQDREKEAAAYAEQQRKEDERKRREQARAVREEEKRRRREEAERRREAERAETEERIRRAERNRIYTPTLALEPERDVMMRWENRVCRWCLARMRPGVVPEHVWPDRPLAATHDACVKCHDEYAA